MSVILHQYIKSGDLDGVIVALNAGADIEGRSRGQNYTPLMTAVSCSATGEDIVRLLIERGANVNAGCAVHGANLLRLTIRFGDVEKTRLLLDHGADIGYTLKEGYTVLIDVMHGRDITKDPDLVRLVTLLMERGADLNGESSFGESALSVASDNGRFDVVKVLLDAGANPAPLRWTHLMHAVAFGSCEDIETLIEAGADLHARDFWSRSPWLLSLQVGNVDKAKLLLAAGADRNDRGRCDKVPLMYPVTNEHISMIEWLVSEGFEIDACDQFQQTALMLAAEMNSISCVKLLLELGADWNRIDNCDGQAISLADDPEVIRVLVEAGADINDINDDARAKITGANNYGDLITNAEAFSRGWRQRFGKDNPERIYEEFWLAMIHGGVDAYEAKRQFPDVSTNGPVWCFRRFGQSINILPDGRIVQVAGEHEDWYDPDFCIYNDVVVRETDGTMTIYGYPREIFPPRDFHTATLVGEFIYIIGSLGYPDERQYGTTPVYKLNCNSFIIEQVTTSGSCPGWISRHKAVTKDNDIIVSGGMIGYVDDDGKDQYEGHKKSFALDLETLEWRELK